MKMKRCLSLLVASLICVGGLALTGCSSSDSSNKKLTDCLALTEKADSMEGTLTTSTKYGGQAIDIKMDIQIENIKEGLKSKVSMELMGKSQEFFLAEDNGQYKMYMQDPSTGKYASTAIDASQLNGMDISKSFDAYIDVIKNNPDMIEKVDDSTYKLNIPKKKTAEIYSKIVGKALTQNFDGLNVKFVIGNDGYLKKVDLDTKTGSSTIKATTDYFNYNKKFNIQIPTV